MSERTIKFRAWDINGKGFVNGFNMFGFSTGQGAPKQKLQRFNDEWHEGDFVIMQYTGLNDLYESDIVETSHHIYDGGLVRRNQVVFKDFCWKFVTLGIDRGSDIPIGLYANYPESIKKIGNIYENPELLK